MPSLSNRRNQGEELLNPRDFRCPLSFVYMPSIFPKIDIDRIVHLDPARAGLRPYVSTIMITTQPFICENITIPLESIRGMTYIG